MCLLAISDDLVADLAAKLARCTLRSGKRSDCRFCVLWGHANLLAKHHRQGWTIAKELRTTWQATADAAAKAVAAMHV